MNIPTVSIEVLQPGKDNKTRIESQVPARPDTAEEAARKKVLAAQKQVQKLQRQLDEMPKDADHKLVKKRDAAVTQLLQVPSCF